MFSQLRPFYHKLLRYPIEQSTFIKISSTSIASIKLSPLQFYYFNLIRSIAFTNRNSVRYYRIDQRHKLPIHFEWVQNQVQKIHYESRGKNRKKIIQSDKDIRIHPLTKLYLQNISYAIYQKLQNSTSKYLNLILGLTEDYLMPTIEFTRQEQSRFQRQIREGPRKHTDFLKSISQIRISQMKSGRKTTQNKRVTTIRNDDASLQIQRSIQAIRSYKLPSLVQLECLYGLIEIISHYPSLYIHIYKKFFNYFNVLIFAMQYNPDKNIQLSDLLCLFVKLVRPWHCNPLFAFDKIDMRPCNFKITGRNSRFRKAFHDISTLRWMLQGMYRCGLSVLKGIWHSRQWIEKKKRILSMSKQEKEQIREKEEKQRVKIQKKKNLLQEFENSSYRESLVKKNKFIGDPSLFCYFLLSEEQNNIKSSGYDMEQYIDYAKQESVYLCQQLFFLVLKKILLRKQFNLHEIQFLSMMTSFLEPKLPQVVDDDRVVSNNDFFFHRQKDENLKADVYIFDNKISITEMMMTPSMTRIGTQHELCFKEMEKYIPSDGIAQSLNLGFEFKERFQHQQNGQIQEHLHDSKFIDEKQNNNNNYNNFNVRNTFSQRKSSSNMLQSYSSTLKRADRVIILRTIAQLHQIREYDIKRLLMSIGARIDQESLKSTRQLVHDTMNKLMRLYGVVSLKDLGQSIERKTNKIEQSKNLMDSKKSSLKRFPSFQDGEDFDVDQSNNRRLRNLDNQEMLRIERIMKRKEKQINLRGIENQVNLDDLSPIARAQYDDRKWLKDLDRKQNLCAYIMARRCSFICDALCRRDQIKSQQDEWKRYKRHPHSNLRFLANVANLGLICFIIALGLFIFEFLL